MKRILIAGCGDVGTRLALVLTRRDHAVWGLRRKSDSLPAPIRPIQADLNDPATLHSLPGDLDTVYYTAAADSFDEAAYRRAYVAGLGNLLAAMAEGLGHPRRLIFTSSTSVFGQTDGSWIDEASPAEPRGFAGRILREAEVMAAAAVRDCCIVRLAGIYGPGRNRLIRLVQSTDARCVEGIYGNRIHADDAAGFLAYLGELATTAPLYIGVDDEPAPICEVMTWLAARLGARAPKMIPSGSDPSAARRGHKRCSNRLLRTSGYGLRYPSYRDGYGALIQQILKSRRSS